MTATYTQWSTLGNMLGTPPSWWPEEDRNRIQAYEKYDQMYWNDPTQYAIRVLENEQPIYVPNARTIVDTTANYLLKGLEVVLKGKDQKFLEDFLKRERFYSKFKSNKKAGITRGDWAFHITADPSKPEGSRVSIDTLHPGMVWKIPSDDDPDEIIRIHIVTQWIDPNDREQKTRIRKLTYEKVMEQGKRRILREEAIWELVPTWYGTEPAPKKVKQIIEPGLLPVEIDQFPVYWFPNIEWESEDFGSSELRGLEFLAWAVSQGTTDTQAALSLEGLGVFATDGGRPVDDTGAEVDWEVAPGKVMEVPSGSYFRRVEGVGSITPMMDQLKYIESKMYQASAMTDVALGQVDVQVAQSGIALAIKFMPTLAKIEDRDTAGVELTTQMFYDLKKWFKAYEGMNIVKDIDINIASAKLPRNPTDILNELNNMFDRKIISRSYYRKEAAKLGYIITDNEDTKIIKELKAMQEVVATSTGTNPQQGSGSGAVDNQTNKSNNQTNPNESGGTEATQTPQQQTKTQ